MRGREGAGLLSIAPPPFFKCLRSVQPPIWPHMAPQYGHRHVSILHTHAHTHTRTHQAPICRVVYKQGSPDSLRCGEGSCQDTKAATAPELGMCPFPGTPGPAQPMDPGALLNLPAPLTVKPGLFRQRPVHSKPQSQRNGAGQGGRGGLWLCLEATKWVFPLQLLQGGLPLAQTQHFRAPLVPSLSKASCPLMAQAKDNYLKQLTFNLLLLPCSACHMLSARKVTRVPWFIHESFPDFPYPTPVLYRALAQGCGFCDCRFRIVGLGSLPVRGCPHQRPPFGPIGVLGIHASWHPTSEEHELPMERVRQYFGGQRALATTTWKLLIKAKLSTCGVHVDSTRSSAEEDAEAVNMALLEEEGAVCYLRVSWLLAKLSLSVAIRDPRSSAPPCKPRGRPSSQRPPLVIVFMKAAAHPDSFIIFPCHSKGSPPDLLSCGSPPTLLLKEEPSAQAEQRRRPAEAKENSQEASALGSLESSRSGEVLLGAGEALLALPSQLLCWRADLVEPRLSGREAVDRRTCSHRYWHSPENASEEEKLFQNRCPPYFSQAALKVPAMPEASPMRVHLDFPNGTTHPLINWTNETFCASEQQVVIPSELFLTLGAMSFVENLLVVAAIVKNRNLHSPMYYFICCLAISDMLVSVSNLVETLFMLLIEHGMLVIEASLVKQVDNVMDMLICSSLMSSLSFLGVIAMDRYITIFYALRYHSIMTIQRAAILMVAVWLVSIVSSILFIAYDSTAVLMCLVAFFLSVLTLIAGLYIHMFMLAHRHARQISTMYGKQHAPQFTSMKGAITLTILLGVFLICWGPFFLHLILILICPSRPACKCYFRYFSLYLILIICNSVVDPIIYAFRSQELRRTLKEVALCLW
ncbi:Melanocyte-stimulating hormone receptor, partial [Ophiophagus hannah]